MPVLADVLGRGPVDVAVGLDDRRDHGVEAGGVVGEPLTQALDGEGARHLTGLVAAHPVGDGEDAVVDEVAVLVLGADLPGCDAAPQRILAITAPPARCSPPGCGRRGGGGASPAAGCR